MKFSQTYHKFELPYGVIKLILSEQETLSILDSGLYVEKEKLIPKSVSRKTRRLAFIEKFV